MRPSDWCTHRDRQTDIQRGIQTGSQVPSGLVTVTLTSPRPALNVSTVNGLVAPTLPPTDSIPTPQLTNVTGRHRGLKPKLPAGYWAPSLQRTSYFSSSSVVSRALSALYVYSNFGHHPHPLSYRCVKFRFFRDLHCWASPWRKIA